MRTVDWYFDFISPFAYLGLHQLGKLPDGVHIRYRPVLFAGLLGHWDNKGPAEIPPKRRWTYRYCHWQARQQGIPFRMPPAHPFNPLSDLRLCIAAGATADSVREIFHSLWATGGDPADPERIKGLADTLGVDLAQLDTPAVKQRLRDETREAAERGVFGVPSLVIDQEIFWGTDALEFARAYLQDPSVIDNPEMRRLDRLPVGASR